MNTRALNKLSYGIYIVSSRKGERLNGQIANTVFQITSEPPTIAICINKNNLTWEFINESKVFTVSILCQDTPLSFIGKFGFKSGRDIEKLNGVNYKLGQTNVAIVLDNTNSYVEAKVSRDMDMGSHTIFIGEIIDADILSEKPGMTYEYYHQVKRGTTPKAAPSYVQEKEELPKLQKYKCKICGWIYDPSIGDPDGNVPPGTPFEKIPNEWRCPVCGASKIDFDKI
jgi:flavin reductase (DIM6/NTAB) family NADH-FMN oxidoreductase RutF/rubredoxin